MDLQHSLDTEPLEAAHPKSPLVVTPEMSVAEVFGELKGHNTGSVLVCRDGRLVGIFTERDALRLMARGDDLSVPIQEVMVSGPVALHSGDTVAQAIRTMADGGYRRLPIVDHAGRPLGVAGVRGIVRYLVEHFPETVYNLPPDPDSATREREGA